MKGITLETNHAVLVWKSTFPVSRKNILTGGSGN
jgi:hypothetical protein